MMVTESRSQTLRAHAAACLQLAQERLDWSELPAVITRYAKDPGRLEGRRQLGLAVMAAAEDLEAAAVRMEAKEKTQ